MFSRETRSTRTHTQRVRSTTIKRDVERQRYVEHVNPSVGIHSSRTYHLCLIMLRMTGKREIGQMLPFDLVLLLMLSNAVQNSMNGGDDSVMAE
jgi:hypothetical protein